MLILNIRKSASAARRGNKNVKFARSERWMDNDDGDEDPLVLNPRIRTGVTKIGHEAKGGTFRKSERWNNDADEVMYDY